MKKIYASVLALVMLMTTGCSTGLLNGLGGLGGETGNGTTTGGGLGDVLGGVLGTLGSQNTQFQFTQDHKFAGKFKGIPLSGSYTYDPSSGTLRLQTVLFSTNAYVTRTTNGMGLTFESKNLLKVLQAAAALSGNSTLQTVGELSKQYDGVRLGFDIVAAR